MGAWYFRHDYGARNDQKLIELDMELGAHIGYALWFQLLEVMGEMDGRLLKSKFNVVAYAMRIDSDMLSQFVRICVRIGLLEETEDEYINQRFSSEYDNIQRRSDINSMNAKKRWDAEKKPAPKKSKKPDIATPESEAVDEMLANIENEMGKGKISNLSNAEKHKLKAKYQDKLPMMLRVFYLWKIGKGKKIKSDYLSILQPWVEEKASSVPAQRVPSRKELLEAQK